MFKIIFLLLITTLTVLSAYVVKFGRRTAHTLHRIKTREAEGEKGDFSPNPSGGRSRHSMGPMAIEAQCSVFQFPITVEWE